jgi:hypothetical protein
MKFKKLVLAVSLLQACFMLAVQSAKADNIQISDAPGEPTTVILTGGPGGTGPFSVSPASCAETAAAQPCSFTISRPGYSIFGAFALESSFNLAESTSPGVPFVTPVSDNLDTSELSSTQVQLHFSSDVAEGNLGLCGSNGCAGFENGSAQTLTGSIIWVNPSAPFGSQIIIDTVSILSDTANESTPAVPEPASLILFGSGLAIAGGFLRRRRRVVTPSVVA